MEFEPVIGLEVHAQLLTRSKAFCGCSTEFGAPPNTNTCPICLGHPGTLPVLNRNLVEYITTMGLATQCTIRPVSTFARKNYFYPDLPKGYQISQYDDPICYNGFVEIEIEHSGPKKIGITRIHMEEDTAKSIEDLDIDRLVDMNRSGVPLIEIVSEPDIRSAREAYLYLQQIRQIVTYLGICNGNMEEGSLRCDANVSLRPKGQEQFGTKTEVKNMNSFRNVEKAIEYEIERQKEVLLNGGTIQQQTMMWDGTRQVTRVMRSKEQAHDYRYFPEPDLVPVHVTHHWIESINVRMPELPLARKRRFMHEFGLPAYDAEILTQDRSLAAYFEDCCQLLKEPSKERYKLVSNWIMTEVMRILSEQKITAAEFNVPPAHIAELVEMFAAEVISSKIAKDIFPHVLEGKSPKEVVEEQGLAQVSDTSYIEVIVDEILANNPDEVERYRSGKVNLFGFFVGQALKATKGKANPKLVTQILQDRLN